LTDLILDVARWVAYGLLIAAAFPTAMAVVQLIKARRAPIYATRQNAYKEARRWMSALLVLLVLALVLLVVPPPVAALLVRPTPVPTATPTAAPTCTATPCPTGTPTATPTRRPTATPPTIPTLTPSLSPPETVLTPLPSAMPARENAHIAIITLAAGEDENGDPVDPGSEFPPGQQRVYLFFTYEGMRTGTQTTFAWYKGEEFIEFCSDTWLWGTVEGRQWGWRGRTSYRCRPPEGWEPGTYEIRVFIETQLQGVAQFVVADE
jgi:hypothetical protein